MKIHFTTPKKFNLLSWLIKKVENRTYSHVVISWDSEELEREMVYQSNIHGMLFIGGEKFHKINQIVRTYELQISREDQKLIKQWCVDASGGKYDVSAILKSALNKFFCLIGWPKIDFKPNGEKMTICSELVIRAIRPIFKDYMTHIDVDLLTPSQLETILKHISLSTGRIYEGQIFHITKDI